MKVLSASGLGMVSPEQIRPFPHTERLVINAKGRAKRVPVSCSSHFYTGEEAELEDAQGIKNTKACCPLFTHESVSGKKKAYLTMLITL